MKKILLILITALAINCGGNKQPAQTQTPDITQKTANGVTVISRGGVSDETLKVIGDATADLIKDEIALGFTVDLDPSIYTVGIVDGCERDSSGIMSFRIRADSYDGSIYDKNPAPGIGEVLAAERVIMNPTQTFPTNSFQICPDTPETMANTTRFGEEHIALAKNNYAEYKRTENHSNGTFHPLIAHRVKDIGQ